MYFPYKVGCAVRASGPWCCGEPYPHAIKRLRSVMPRSANSLPAFHPLLHRIAVLLLAACTRGRAEQQHLQVLLPEFQEETAHRLLVSDVPVSLRVEAMGDFHYNGDFDCAHYWFAAMLNGIQVTVARAEGPGGSGTDFGTDRPELGSRCVAGLTLAPLPPGKHEILVALHYFRVVLFEKPARGPGGEHIVLFEKPARGQGREHNVLFDEFRFLMLSDVVSVDVTDAEGAAEDREEITDAMCESPSPQFVPRDELEAKAWSAAGYYKSRTNADRDLAGVVVVVVANFAYRDMLANWMCHADRLGIKYLVGMVDRSVSLWMKQHFPHVHTYELEGAGSEETDAQNPGENSYMCVGMLRIVWSCHELVLRLLQRGLSVLYMDTDAVLLRDPVAAVRHSCDFVYQQNHCGDALPARVATRHTEPNAGFYFAAPSKLFPEVMRQVKKKLPGNVGGSAQVALPPAKFVPKEYCVQNLLWKTLAFFAVAEARTTFFSPPRARDGDQRGREPDSDDSLCALDGHEFATGMPERVICITQKSLIFPEKRPAKACSLHRMGAQCLLICRHPGSGGGTACYMRHRKARQGGSATSARAVVHQRPFLSLMCLSVRRLEEEGDGRIWAPPHLGTPLLHFIETLFRGFL